MAFALIAGIAAAAPAIITGGLAAWSWGAFALGAGLSMLSRALMPSIESSTTGAIDGGTTVTGRDATSSRKVIYGETRVGGDIVFMDTTGGQKANANLQLVIAYAGHVITEYSEVWLGDQKAWGTDTFTLSDRISTTSGSNVVRVDVDTILDTYQYVFSEDNQITISGTSAVGGLNLNGTFTITAVDDYDPEVEDDRENHGKWFEFEAGSNATSTATNGGGTDWQVVQLGYVGSTAVSWGDYLELYFYLGDQTTYNAKLRARSVPWNTNCILQGTAYIYAQLKYDSEIFRAGMPNVSAKIKGKKVANLAGVVEWTDNPALCIRDYLLDERYGLGEDAATIDVDAFTNAVNVCNQSVALDGGGTEKRYTLNGMLNTHKSRKANIEDMLSAMGGKLVYSGAKYFITPAYYATPTITIDETVLNGEIQIQTRQSRRQLYNAVKGSFISKEKNYIVADYPAQKSSTFATADGGELFLDMALPYVTGNTQAQRLAKIAMLSSRKATTVTLPCNLAALKFKAGDNIMVSNAKMGWVSKVFEVLSYKMHPNSDGTISVDVSAIETASDVYDWGTSDQQDFLDAGEINLFVGKDVAPPTSLVLSVTTASLSDGTKENNLQAAWTASPDSFLDHYIVKYKPTSGGDTVIFLTDNTPFKIPNLQPATGYTVEVIAVNELGYKSTKISGTQTTQGDFVPDVPSIYRISKSGGAAPTAGEFTTAAGRNPKNADAVITTDTSASPVQTHAWTYNLSGTAWTQDDNLISGDLIVNGSITGNEIKADSITANKLSGDVSELFPIRAYQATTLTASEQYLQEFSLPAPELGISKRARLDIASNYTIIKTGSNQRDFTIQQSIQIKSKSATGVQVGATGGVVADGFPFLYKQKIYIAGNHLAELDTIGGVADNASGTGFGNVDGLWYDENLNRTYMLVGQSTTVFSTGETLYFNPYRFTASGTFVSPVYQENQRVVMLSDVGSDDVTITVPYTFGSTTTATVFRIATRVSTVYSDVTITARGFRGTMELVS
jgi:hypothetical protein